MLQTVCFKCNYPLKNISILFVNSVVYLNSFSFFLLTEKAGFLQITSPVKEIWVVTNVCRKQKCYSLMPLWIYYGCVPWFHHLSCLISYSLNSTLTIVYPFSWKTNLTVWKLRIPKNVLIISPAIYVKTFLMCRIIAKLGRKK